MGGGEGVIQQGKSGVRTTTMEENPLVREMKNVSRFLFVYFIQTLQYNRTRQFNAVKISGSSQCARTRNLACDVDDKFKCKHKLTFVDPYRSIYPAQTHAAAPYRAWQFHFLYGTISLFLSFFFLSNKICLFFLPRLLA